MTQHADTFFIESARRTIALEGAAISALSSALDESFAEACRHIMSTAGRVVVTGIGKSGHIAGKSQRHWRAQVHRLFLSILLKHHMAIWE